MQQWYEELFENYARKYDSESFTQGTRGECDFIESEIAFDRSQRILDIGCGTGRHALQRAQEKAAAENLHIVFEKHDARNLPFRQEFQVAIMLCEGAFPLMETDEMNFQILQSAARALQPNGKLIFTTLNGLFPLFHSVKEFLNAATQAGNATYGQNTFDLMTFRDHNVTSFEDDLGNKKELRCNERYYVPSEITWLLNSLEFKTVDIFGAKLGAFSRSEALTTEDFEMLVIATK
ncbi:class I SAM-dependent methyltransferase [candidate division KSB1 bacterium]|nr:class I SAM-dependent methyltransferase [candidate division KSB1 bacterium]